LIAGNARGHRTTSKAKLNLTLLATLTDRFDRDPGPAVLVVGTAHAPKHLRLSQEKHMRKSLTTFISAASLTLAVACSQSDVGITTAVKAKLAQDDTVKAYQIDVDTSGKVVTLSGSVDNAATKARAVAVARQTNGVREVVDHIDVSAATATTGRDAVDDGLKTSAEDAAQRAAAVTADAAITTAVKTRLAADSRVSALKIDVDTSNGIVTLKGRVRSPAEADQAVRLARDTNGVARVVNELTVGH
jgi:osmotically-inducible protein OsmY